MKTAIIFFLAFILRLSWAFITNSHVHPELWEYEQIAINILNGQGFTYFYLGTVYYSFTAPLYSFLCAAVYFLTNHSYLALLIVQSFISSFICILIFKIAKELFSENVARIAALFVALHPALIIYASKLHPLFIDSFFMCLIVFMFLRLKSNFSFRNKLFTGFISGLSVLSRPTIALFLPFSAIWLFYKNNFSKKKIFFSVFLIVFISFIIISPWIIRNCSVHKQFVALQSNGQVFWFGNNPLATGTSHQENGSPLKSLSPDLSRKVQGLNEIEQSELFWKEGFNFIKSNPLKFLSLFARKFYYFWWFSPHSGIEYPKIYFSIYKLLYIGISIFAAIGLILALKVGKDLVKQKIYLILGCLLLISLTQSFFYIEGRHRWAIEPLILIFTAKGFVYMKDKLCLKTKT